MAFPTGQLAPAATIALTVDTVPYLNNFDTDYRVVTRG